MRQITLFGKQTEPIEKAADKTKAKEVLKRVQKSQETRKRSIRQSNYSGILAKVDAAVQIAKANLVPRDDLKLITDHDVLTDYVDKLLLSDVIAVDTESSGLSPIDDPCVGVSFSGYGVPSVYVPFGHTDYNNTLLAAQIDVVSVEKQFSRIKARKLIFHNAKYDLRVIKNRFGMWLDPYWCTLLAGYYLNETESHELKPMWDKYCAKGEKKSSKFNDLFNGIPFNYIPPEIAYLYAADDTHKTLELYDFQVNHLHPASDSANLRDLADAGKFFLTVEMPLSRVIAEMEETGICIDKDLAVPLSEDYEIRIKEAEEKAISYFSDINFDELPLSSREKLSTPINLGSPKQLGIVLYEALGLKGNGSTDEAALNELAEKNPQYREMLEAVLYLRQLKKLLSTYVKKMPNLVKEKTGRLHCSFNAYGAATGRFSSSNPNLQNIPSKKKDSKIRKMFCVRNGFAMISGDFS